MTRPVIEHMNNNLVNRLGIYIHIEIEHSTAHINDRALSTLYKILDKV